MIKWSLELSWGKSHSWFLLYAFIKSRHGRGNKSYYAWNLKLMVVSSPISESDNEEVAGFLGIIEDGNVLEFNMTT